MAEKMATMTVGQLRAAISSVPDESFVHVAGDGTTFTVESVALHGAFQFIELNTGGEIGPYDEVVAVAD